MNSRFFSGTLTRLRGREGETFILFALFAAILSGIIWSTAFHLIALERAGAERAALESTAELVETYEAQMARSLGAIDQTLKTVKYAVELKGKQFSLAELQEKGLLPPTLVFTIRVVDRNGDIAAGSRPHELAPVADQPYFRVHRERDSGAPFAGAASRNPASGAPELQFSRRLNGADGSFGGIVILSVDPAYFTSGYERSRLGEHGVLALLGADGIFLVKRSGDNVTSGDAVGYEAATRGIDAQSGNSTLVTSPWDGVRRYTNMRRLHGFPLTVIAGLSESEQFAVFHQRKSTYLWQAIAASGLLVVIVGVMGRFTWQLAKSRWRMRKVQETFYAASEASLDAFFVLRSVRDGSGEIVDFTFDDMNRRGEQLLGTAKQAILGKTICEMFSNSSTNGVLAELVAVATTGEVREKEWQNREPAVRAEWLYREVVRVEDGVVAIVRDITERKRAEVLRIEQGRVLEMIASSTPLNEVLASLTQLIELQAPRIIASVRLLEEDGSRLRHAAAPNLPQHYIRDIDALVVGPTTGTCGAALYQHTAVVAADILDSPLWKDCRGLAAVHGLRASWSTPILSHQGKAVGTLALYAREVHEPSAAERQLADMATHIAGIAIEHRQSEERIRHMAHHDALTGLPNRVLLDDRLKQAMLHAQRDARLVVVAFIDLDDFKLINDSLGHNVGDELLKIVADRMVRCVRRTDTVARLGGDEFVIVMPDQQEKADSVTPMLHKIRDAIAQPIHIDRQKIQVTCSMGLAVYPDDGADTHTLLRNADAAMYRAKDFGHNKYQFYTAEINARIHEKLALQDGLRDAVAHEEFILLYQPQVDLRSGRMLGVEALIRWQRPGQGLIGPAQFISVAEETGLIVPMGDWAMRAACRQNKAWQDAGMAPITISVNVSARQFKEENLVARVAHALQESGLAAEYLELELTESLLMQDMQRSIDTMRELQAMGVHLSIDDFGTGYSSLSALKRFPIVRLKIDKSFVQELPDNEDDKAIAMAVISLGHQLKLRVTAEGVETRQQLDFLRDNDCDEMQGYYFSRPVCAADIEKLAAGHG